jgi:peptidoglycan/xylan/chitin deacetylase (PgdA/CDA1 family)
MLIISYLLIVGAGIIFTQLNFFVEQELAGDARYNEIALSFDDGPNEEYTPQVLAKLDEYGVIASFFLIGEQVKAHPELVKKIHDQGHIIGNHSYAHHNNFAISSLKSMTDEIALCQQEIAQKIGQKPQYFRPPFGVTNPRIAKAIKQSGLTPVAWNLRTYDDSKSTQRVIKKLKKNLSGGDIILLHDKHEGIVEILDFLIPYALESGLKIVPMDKLLNLKAYE